MIHECRIYRAGKLASPTIFPNIQDAITHAKTMLKAHPRASYDILQTVATVTNKLPPKPSPDIEFHLLNQLKRMLVGDDMPIQTLKHAEYMLRLTSKIPNCTFKFVAPPDNQLDPKYLLRRIK